MNFDAELIWWVVAGIMCVLFACALPMIINYYEYKENERRFAR